MLARQQHHERLRAHRLLGELLLDRVAEHADIQLAGAHQLAHLLSRVHRHLHLDAGIAPAEEGEGAREERARAEPGQPDAQDSRLQAAQLRELGNQVVALREQRHRAPVDELARCCQADPAADAVEQTQAELVLELPHRLADRGLSGMELLRRAREAAVADHFHENAQAA